VRHRSKPTPEQEERVVRAAYEKAGSSHHRLPQFYLRKFAGKNGRLELFHRNTGQRESRPPRRTFAEEGYYTIRDEDEQPFALAEALYESLENRASRLHGRLLEGESPAAFDNVQRSDYGFFLAAQITRGEAFRAFARRAGEMIGKETLRVQAEKVEAWWDNFVSELKRRGEEPPKLTAEEYRDFVRRDQFRLEMSREHHMELSVMLLPDLAEVIINFAWHTVHLPEALLLTHEEPLSLWRSPSPEPERPALGLGTCEEIRIALSPSCALILTHPSLGFTDRAGRGNERTAAWLNYWTYLFQHRGALVLCPDRAGQHLPVADLLNPGFAAGPIVTE
jgi:hypothetical protein